MGREPPTPYFQDGKVVRDDVAAADVVRKRTQTEVEVDGRTLRLTNLRKVLYPDAGFTKAQVLH